MVCQVYSYPKKRTIEAGGRAAPVRRHDCPHRKKTKGRRSPLNRPLSAPRTPTQTTSNQQHTRHFRPKTQFFHISASWDRPLSPAKQRDAAFSFAAFSFNAWPHAADRSRNGMDETASNSARFTNMPVGRLRALRRGERQAESRSSARQ
jgi:hypothetical protein